MEVDGRVITTTVVVNASTGLGFGPPTGRRWSRKRSESEDGELYKTENL